MDSFTKDIINKPNVVVGKFQKKRNKSGQVKVKKEDYYIYQQNHKFDEIKFYLYD